MSNMDRYLTSKYKSSKTITNKEKDYWIRYALRHNGRAWVIGAMVEGSIGYHTPSHANRLIDRFLSGHKTDWCERCDACYRCDLIYMIYDDIRMFDWMDQDRANRIVEAMKVVIGWTDAQQMSVSLGFPTMGF